MKQLQNRVAIVTGASKGIGKAIARAFAMAGASVLIAARDRAALDAVASEIAREGGAVLAVPTDVTVEAVSGADVVEKASTHVRRLRYLMEAVVHWGETLTFRGEKDPGLPPAR